eukprot:4911757-Prymnesium_polylepis.1
MQAQEQMFYRPPDLPKWDNSHLPKWDKLQRGSMIGAGFFGGVRAVWLGEQLRGLKLVPLMSDGRDGDMREMDAERLGAEVEKLVAIDHPNVRQLVGLVVEPNNP